MHGNLLAPYFACLQSLLGLALARAGRSGDPGKWCDRKGHSARWASCARWSEHRPHLSRRDCRLSRHDCAVHAPGAADGNPLRRPGRHLGSQTCSCASDRAGWASYRRRGRANGFAGTLRRLRLSTAGRGGATTSGPRPPSARRSVRESARWMVFSPAAGASAWAFSAAAAWAKAH